MTYRFLACLDLASRANAGQESATDDFLRLQVSTRSARSFARDTIPFVGIAIELLVHLNSMILLVVQEDKTTSDPEPQIIAEAITTFQRNNQKRGP